MKLSVVLSIYNGEKYIIEQLDSLRQQTRLPDEVLMYDDGSTDKTPELVTAYLAKYGLDNWKYISNQVNKGWRKNFMEGMWSATGEIVFSCDQDDIWRKDKLQVMEQIMEKNPQISLLVSNYRMFYPDGSEKIGPRKNKQNLERIELTNNFLLVQSPGCTHCIRKELLDLSKKYWRPEYAHDALLWRLSLFDNGLYIYTDDLIKWRKHENSAFSVESRELKNIRAKKDWINVAQTFEKMLRVYTLTDVSGVKTKQLKVLNRNAKWLAQRQKFYNTKNPLQGIILAMYWDCFPRYRQYLGDWYLLYIKRK